MKVHLVAQVSPSTGRVYSWTVCKDEDEAKSIAATYDSIPDRCRVMIGEVELVEWTQFQGCKFYG